MFNAKLMNELAKNRFAEWENEIETSALKRQTSIEFSIDSDLVEEFCKHFHQLDFDVSASKKTKTFEDFRSGSYQYRKVTVSWKDK